jgi:hypothetical protein
MSAARWLAFVGSIGILALVGAILNEFVDPIINTASSQSTTQASQQGIEWYTQAWEWMPLAVLLLAMIAVLVGIIVRRRGVTR